MLRRKADKRNIKTMKYGEIFGIFKYEDKDALGEYSEACVYCIFYDGRLHFSPHGVEVLTGINRKQIQGYCKKGEIKCVRTISGYWYVPVEEVERLKEEKRNDS